MTNQSQVNLAQNDRSKSNWELAITPIFLVGVGRSGTSLLQSMLASHSGIVSLPETSAVRRIVVPRKLHHVNRKFGLDGVVRFLEADERLAALEIDWSEFVSNLHLNDSNRIDLEWYQAVLRYWQQDAQWVLDKDPKLIEHLSFLERSFSCCSVLQMLRDPRDVLASKQKAKWARKRHWLTHVLANRFQYRLGEKSNEELCHFVRYGDLLEQPEITLTAICERLRLKYDGRMLRFQDEAVRLVRDDEVSWKKETFGPLLVSNRGKWRRELSSIQACTTEIACRSAMLSTGSKRGSWSLFTKLMSTILAAQIVFAELLLRVRHWTVDRRDAN